MKKRIIKAFALAGIVTVIIALLVAALCCIDQQNGANASIAIPVITAVVYPIAFLIGMQL